MEKKAPRKSIGRVWQTLLSVFCMIICLTLLQVIALKYINPFFTPNTAWEWAESIWTKTPEKRPVFIWKNIDLISPHLQKAVIAAEDQRFFSHNGFDIDEIKQALKTLIKRKRLRGASTISMQTARSVFWLSSKSIARKTAEIYYTILIELIWDKQRILEMYLNTVDWGTGVTGAEAASQKYFSTSARNLTNEQAALMAAVLPNPHRWSVRSPSPYIKKRRIRIMTIMERIPL